MSDKQDKTSDESAIIKDWREINDTMTRIKNWERGRNTPYPRRGIPNKTLVKHSKVLFGDSARGLKGLKNEFEDLRTQVKWGFGILIPTAVLVLTQTLIKLINAFGNLAQ